MERIDRTWLRDRLDRLGRGSQKKLADHLRIHPTMISKILSGDRQIKGAEIPQILSFFDEPADQAKLEGELAQIVPLLTDKLLDDVIDYARYKLDQQAREQSVQLHSDELDRAD